MEKLVDRMEKICYSFKRIAKEDAWLNRGQEFWTVFETLAKRFGDIGTVGDYVNKDDTAEFGRKPGMFSDLRRLVWNTMSV